MPALIDASTEPGSLAAAFSTSPRDAFPLKLAAGALGSLVAHLLFVGMFTAAWLQPRTLEEEAARKNLPPPPPPIEWVEADLGATDAQVADQNLEEKEEEPQGAAPTPAPAPLAPVAPPEPAPTKAAPPPAPTPPAKARPSPGPQAEKMAVLHVLESGPSSATDMVAVRGTPTGSGDASVGRVGSVAPSADGSVPGGQGGPHVERAPDLAARFTKELPRWAADVPGWQSAHDGFTLERTVVVRLDEEGRVDREARLGKEGEDDALLSSIQRTLRALVTPLALPDRPRGPGALTLQIRGVVTDGPPRDAGEEIALAFDYDKKLRSGNGSLSKRDGRGVLFTVKVVSVEAAAPAGEEASPAPPGAPPAPPAPEEPPPAASGSGSAAPPPPAASERVLPSNR